MSSRRAATSVGMEPILHVERRPSQRPAGAGADANPPKKGASEAETRCAPRTLRRSRAQLILYPPARHPHAFEVSIVDYSATGIGIVHSEGLLVGQTYVVREPYVTRDKTCLFTVVRSERRPDGQWSIGLHVGNTLKDELAPIVADAPAPGIDLWTKLLFLTFAIAGAITVVLVAVLRSHGK